VQSVLLVVTPASHAVKVTFSNHSIAILTDKQLSSFSRNSSLCLLTFTGGGGGGGGTTVVQQQPHPMIIQQPGGGGGYYQPNQPYYGPQPYPQQQYPMPGNKGDPFLAQPYGGGGGFAPTGPVGNIPPYPQGNGQYNFNNPQGPPPPYPQPYPPQSDPNYPPKF